MEITQVVFIGVFLLFIITTIFVVKWLKVNINQINITISELKKNIPDPQQENVENLLTLNKDIKDCLQTILVNLNADWVQLWQFHNGIHGLGIGRIPFLFLAVTHEVCKEPKDKTLEGFAQLPLSVYGECITAIKYSDVLIFQEFINKTSPISQLVSPVGAKAGFFRTIRDKDDQIIGFVSALWKTDYLNIGSKKLDFINGCQRMTAVLASDSIKKEEKSGN
jgi:hypothetical protein